MAGFPENLAAGSKGKEFPMFSDVASDRVAQALRKGSQFCFLLQRRSV